VNAATNPVDEIRLGLFISQAKIRSNQDALKNQVRKHLARGGDYVLFRNSSLYFLQGGRVCSVLETQDGYDKAEYLRFDGTRVSRINPEYYLGPVSPRQAHVPASKDEMDINWDRNSDADVDAGGGLGSNNNNNNNNGNNNGNNG